MQIIELGSGEDGRSYTRDYTPEEFARIAHRASGPVTVAVPNSIRARPGGFVADWHPFLGGLAVMCTGISEYETADGVRRLYPGDIVMIQDPTGQGHRFVVASLESRIALSAKWAQETPDHEGQA